MILALKTLGAKELKVLHPRKFISWDWMMVYFTGIETVKEDLKVTKSLERTEPTHPGSIHITKL